MSKIEKYICEHCGYIGKPTTSTKGNILFEIILWFLFLIPGIFYSIWRLTTKEKNVCPKCKNTSMIPIDTPLGQKLFKK